MIKLKRIYDAGLRMIHANGSSSGGDTVSSCESTASRLSMSSHPRVAAAGVRLGAVDNIPCNDYP
jgi:hypothetical protein